MPQTPTNRRKVLVRDFVIFQLKLALDGLKDVFVFQLTFIAALLDLLMAGDRRPSFFYGLIRRTERFDLWLNLYGATKSVDQTDDGLFGASSAGSDTLLGKLEEWVRQKREEPPTESGATGEYTEPG